MFYCNRLKFLRERIGVTQEHLASILNIKQSVYSHYETEYYIMPIKHLNTLCNYYNVSFDYLFEFTNQKNYKNINEIINREKVGMILKSFRKENKITQTELAKLLNTSQSVIVEYEKGTTLLTTTFLYSICTHYKISADYLLGRIDKKNYF